MAQQEDGWPLGLATVNARIRLVRNGELPRSVSCSTMFTSSPTCSIGSSSDLDSQSTESIFRDKSITLGSLIGIPNLEPSRRSTGERVVEPSKDEKNHKLRPWLFSLCSMPTTDSFTVRESPSLGQYFEAERRAESSCRKNQ